MAKPTQSDIALSALAAEAERRRKARGLLRFSYGDLVAETSLEERQEIIEAYKKDRRRRVDGTGERFAKPNDKEDLRSIRQKRGIPEEKPVFRPTKKKITPITGSPKE